jgi:hypothetical protein
VFEESERRLQSLLTRKTREEGVCRHHAEKRHDKGFPFPQFSSAATRSSELKLGQIPCTTINVIGWVPYAISLLSDSRYVHGGNRVCFAWLLNFQSRHAGWGTHRDSGNANDARTGVLDVRRPISINQSSRVSGEVLSPERSELWNKKGLDW